MAMLQNSLQSTAQMSEALLPTNDVRNIEMQVAANNDKSENTTTKVQKKVLF